MTKQPPEKPRTRYLAKIKIISLGLSVVLIFLCVFGLTKTGIISLTNEATTEIQNKIKIIENDKIKYEIIPGDILDTNATVIMTSQDYITSDKMPTYDKSYSHLLGRLNLNTSGMLNNYTAPLFDSELSNDANENKGRSIMLTIDDKLQRYIYDKFSGKRASVIVMERKSGKLLACTSNYAENDFNLGTEKLTDATLKKYNNATEPIWLPEYLNGYTPGSVFKIVTSACGVENNLADFTINDKGKVKYNNQEIINCDEVSYGDNLDINKAFVYSSNTYFAQLAVQLTQTKMMNLLDKLKFNQTINTDFCSFRNYSNLGESSHDIASIGFGEGDAKISSLGIALYTQGIIEGQCYKPHICKNFGHYTQDGKYKVDETVREEIIAMNTVSDTTSEAVKGFMYNAAEKYGLPENILGAKTGTAQFMEGWERGTFVGFDSKYIVVISQVKEGKIFGYSHKEMLIDIFDKLKQ